MSLNPIHVTKAIRLLRPNSEFVMQNSDYSTIEWHILEGDAPTEKEVKEAIEVVMEQEKQAEANAIKAKQIAEAKLVALGLTNDDLKALGLG